MKRIQENTVTEVATVAVALSQVAGSVDVEAQKRSTQKTSGAQPKTPKDAEEASKPMNVIVVDADFLNDL